MKKAFCLLLTLIMVVTVLPISLTASAEDITYNIGDIVEFGSYPQTKITSEDVKAELETLAGDVETWTSYGYFSGSGKWDDGKMTAKDYMKYKDVTYGETTYRGVVFTEYRPFSTGYKTTDNMSYQDDNGYFVDEIYWFKFKPIKWRVLDPKTGLVMSESILDSQAFMNCIATEESSEEETTKKDKTYGNNWEQSSIRAWLNDSFFNTVFSEAEKAQILTATLSNPAYSKTASDFDCAETSDKVFLLSYEEVKNSFFGFDTGTGSSAQRVGRGTAYAKAQGLTVDDENGTSGWRLRTAGLTGDNVCYVNNDGSVYPLNNYSLTNYGVRPAVYLEIVSTDSEGVPGQNYEKDKDFIQKLKEFFQKIVDFFKSLFPKK